MNSNAGRGFLKAVLIVGFIFIVSYFYSYNKWLKHDFNSVDITYRYNDEEQIEQNNNNDIDVSKEFKDKYENINYELFESYYGEEFFDVFYNNAKMNDDFYIYLGVINYIKSDAAINCRYETNITSKDLKEKVTSLVGNVKYEDKSFTSKNGYLTINYDENQNNYLIKVNNKCGGIDYSLGGIKTIYQKALKDDNNLYIYEKALYMKSIKDSNENITFNYYDSISSDSKVIANSYDKIDTDSLPTYVYKFSINNDVYTLESITKQ